MVKNFRNVPLSKVILFHIAAFACIKWIGFLS